MLNTFIYVEWMKCLHRNKHECSMLYKHQVDLFNYHPHYDNHINVIQRIFLMTFIRSKHKDSGGIESVLIVFCFTWSIPRISGMKILTDFIVRWLFWLFDWNHANVHLTSFTIEIIDCHIKTNEPTNKFDCGKVLW